VQPLPTKPFKGVIKLDVRDPKPDWDPFTLPRAPKRAPKARDCGDHTARKHIIA
jgi:hypothetical protein